MMDCFFISCEEEVKAHPDCSSGRYFLAASLIQHAMNDSNYLTEHKQLDLRSATVPLKIDGVRSSQDHDLTQKR